MNKKLLALAVAGAFVAPVAMADTSNVVIGGQMHFSLDSLKGWNGKTGAAADLSNNWNVSSNSSNIYFKGTEDLGNGLSAIWQIQTYFSAGGTGNSDAGVGYYDGFSSGNTYVGVSSKSWGTVMLGKMEAPFKLIGRKVDLFNNQIGDTRNLLQKGANLNNLQASPGPGVGAVGLSPGWENRPQNTIAYATPSFNGLTGTIAYVTNMEVNNNFAGAAVNGTTNDFSVDAWSASVVYDNGPIYVGLAYERHNLANMNGFGPYANLNDEKAWRLAGGYNFGDFKVTALYQRETDLCVGNVATPGNCTKNDGDRTSWGLGGAYKMGANTIKAQYYRTGDTGDVKDTSANMWALGFDHALSKRTTVYAAYAKTNNDNAVRYSAFGGGHGDNPMVGAPGPLNGKDPSGFSLGVIHNF
ncbi:porin [Thiobacter aerophilum]|uniref:Porin n=1 Tax=Thiobacter aerophilum TaxID=3121275 RepID=A0ABV0EH69_9BURK